MTRLKISHLRTHLREAIERVKGGEEIEIVQNGVPVAVLVHPDRLRPRVVTPNTRAAEALMAEYQAAKERIRREGLKLPEQGLSPERAEELVQDIYRQRQAGK